MDVGARSEDPPRVWAEQDPPRDPKKLKLEKRWDRAQVAYGAILFGSLFYMGAVQESLKDDPGTLATVLIIFGTLWCFLALGFFVHLYAKKSKTAQRFTIIPPIFFLLAFPYLVAAHIYYLIPNKKAARIFFIVKVTLVSGFYVVMLILVIRKACSNAIAAATAPVSRPTGFDYDSDSPRRYHPTNGERNV